MTGLTLASAGGCEGNDYREQHHDDAHAIVEPESEPDLGFFENDRGNG